METSSNYRINLYIKTVLVIVACLAFFSNRALATHAMGIDLTYECLGGNQYEFTLNFYRDCSGSTAPASVSININSVSCSSTNTLLLNQSGTETEISPLCASAVSTCNGGTNPGVEHYEYKGTLTLPANCPDWVFSYGICCRNNAITNLVSPASQDIYIESTLDNSSGLCNSSPAFTTLPVPYICKDQLTNYGFGATDSDGDSVAYSLVNAMGGAGTLLAYVAPYTAGYPITTDSGFVVLDSLTGNLTLTPDTTQTCIVTVMVEEYRNGVLIGSIMRDIQVLVLDCGANTQPAIKSPLITNLTGGSLLVDSNSIEVCVGVPVIFDLTAADIDAGDTVLLTTNLANTIPGAVFDTTGVNPVIGSFTWTPTAGDIGFNSFTATVQDNNCPIIGKQTYVFDINVFDGIYAGPDVVTCGVDSIQLSASGSLNYSWSPGAGLSDSTISNPMALVTNTTMFILTGDSSGTCKYIDTVNIIVDTSNSITLSATNTDICEGDSVGLSVVGSQGLPNASTWTYAWAPAASISDTTIAAPMAYPLDTTTYALVVTNSCGTFTDSITINTQTAPSADAGLDTNFCYGGSVQLTGTGGGSYLWSPSQFLSCTACDKTNANPPTDMTYYLTVTDSFGCVDTDSVLVEVNGIPVSATATPSSVCFPTDTVQLEVSGSGDISDNFDPMIDGTVWTTIAGATSSLGCGSVSGNALYFDGTTRYAETIDVNVTGGGTIDFWLIYGKNGTAPCEFLDAVVEQVDLDYSVNGGVSWVNINTYSSSLYATFTFLSETIPSAAQTGTTRFRWNQSTFSGPTFDHWSIDEMLINTIGDTLDSTAIINWSPGVTLDDSTSITPIAMPGGQMTYIVTVADQGCITSDTITIYSDSTVITTTSDTTICQGTSGVIGVTSNTTTVSYLWSPATGLSDTTAQFPTASPTSTTTYSVDVTNTAGCMYTDSVVVTMDTLPTASFTEASTDLTVTFTNTSIGGTSYYWDFGDGFLATVANPVHTYLGNGTYNVCLTAVNDCGTDTSCTNVTVTLGGCINTVADFDTITVGLTAVFTDMSTDATGWLWDFGDGNTSSAKNPVYTYTAAGTYNVCLITTNACSSDTVCTMITITSETPCTPTTAGFTSNSVGLDAVFMDASSDATSWSWDFGDASTSTDQNPVHTYATDGTYNVCLTTTNACSSDTSCVNVTVADSSCTPATAAFTSTPSGLTVAFTDASTDPSAWGWDFGDGNTSTAQNPSYTYAAAGTYNVCLIVTNPCSADTSCANTTVTVCATPVASFTPSSSDLTVTFADASTNTTSWSWNFGDGNTSSSQHPTYSYSTAGTYNVCLIANSGCATDMMCDSVTVTSCPSVTAAFTYSDSTLTVDFTDLSVGADTWSWDFGDGVNSSAQNASHTYASAGTYTVCLTASSACTSDITCIVVTVATVGLEESKLDNLRLFPNPTDGILHISIPAGLEQDMTFTIYNILGEVVFETVASKLKYKTSSGVQKDYSIDLRYLANGSYLLRATSGDRLFTERVVFYK